MIQIHFIEPSLIFSGSHLGFFVSAVQRASISVPFLLLFQLLGGVLVILLRFRSHFFVVGGREVDSFGRRRRSTIVFDDFVSDVGGGVDDVEGRHGRG